MKPKKSFFQSIFTGDKDKVDVGNKEDQVDINVKVENIANFENDSNDLSKEAINIVNEIINENIGNMNNPTVEADVKIYDKETEKNNEAKTEKEKEPVKVDFVYQELTNDLIDQLLDGTVTQTIKSNDDNKNNKDSKNDKDSKDDDGMNMPLI